MAQQQDKPIDYFKNHGVPTGKTVTEEDIQFYELCYKIFTVSEDGKRLADMLKERYIMKRLAQHYDGTEMAYFEGYKEGYRDLLNAASNYLVALNSVLKGDIK